MSSYNNDQPIDGSINNTDKLHREKFSKGLADLLVLDGSSDCLTVSIEAKWGMGKSSVINLVKRQLDERKESGRKIAVMEYNPWLVGDSELLVQDFLRQFASQLNIHLNSEKGLRVAEEVLSYSNLFGVVKLIPGAEPWASLVETVMNNAASATQKISKLKELDTLGKKQKISDLISTMDLSIIVIIDDIDRLTPAEAFEVIRLVKAVADFKGCSFLLSYDPTYLEGILAKHSIQNVSEYLDKIVQLRLPLPVIAPTDLEVIFNEQFNQLIGDISQKHFDLTRERLNQIYNYSFKKLVLSPRDVKRFINHLRFVLGQIREEVALSDLFGLSLLAVKANSLYEEIKRIPENYVGKSFDGGISHLRFQSDEDNQYNEKFKIDLPDEQLNAVKELLGILFDGSNRESADKFGYVLSFERLYIATHLDIPKGQVSQVQIKQFVSGKLDDSTQFLKRVIELGAGSRFLDLIRYEIESFAGKEFDLLSQINNVFLETGWLRNQVENKSGFAFDDSSRQLGTVNKIVLTVGDNLNIELFKQLLQIDKFIPVLVEVWGSLTASDRKKDYLSSLSKEERGELELILLSQSKKVLQNKVHQGTLLEAKISFLFFWIENSGTELFKSILQEEGIYRLAEILGYSGIDSTGGLFFDSREESLQKIMSPEVLKQKACEYLSSNTSDIENRVKAVLLSLCNGGKYYLSNAKKSDW